MMNDERKGITPAALKAFLEGDLDNFAVASTPGGIEAQEAAGQQTFVASETLPKEMIHGCTREKLESMGIVFGDEVDDLFISCTLPSGWTKRPTEHAMWSELLDDNGRVRAQMFYKAAFYDRTAHISLSRRFCPAYMPEDDYKQELTYSEREGGNWYGVVRDCENIVFKTEACAGNKDGAYAVRDALAKKAQEWLEKKYPNWQDPLAYWD